MPEGTPDHWWGAQGPRRAPKLVLLGREPRTSWNRLRYSRAWQWRPDNFSGITHIARRECNSQSRARDSSERSKLPHVIRSTVNVVSETPRARLVAYGVAVLAPALSLLVRWPLWPVLGNAVPRMTFMPAVMIAAYFGGFWPGLVATVLSGVAATYFFTRQVPAYRVTTVDDRLALILFVLVGTIISGLCESLHRARRRIVAEERYLAEERELLLKRLRRFLVDS